MIKETVPLREYFEQKFESSDKAVAAALAAAEKAVLKAENANEKRFENVNEFRQTLSDQQKLFATKIETQLINEGIVARLKTIEDKHALESGERGGAKNLWIVILGVMNVISIIVGLTAYFIKP